MTKKLLLPIAIAALLWFVMFSPWTAPHVNFWLTMSFAGVVLTSLSLLLFPDLTKHLRSSFGWRHVVGGVVLALLLWCVFWVGDKVACWIFPFADGEIGSIYSMKDGTSPWLIAPLLLLVIGPAEEISWRGYVQRTLSLRWNNNIGFIATTLIYALVHAGSCNFMLTMAALVAGAAWGLLYRFFPDRFAAIIISHAIWDVVVFIWLPIQ